MNTEKKKMNNKTIIAIIAVLIGAVIVAVIVGIVIFNKKKAKNTAIDSTIPVTDFQKALDDVLITDDYSQMPLFLSSLKQASSCEVISVSHSEDSNTYTALVSVKYADVASDLVNYLEENTSTTFDEEKLNKDIAELVSNAEQATSECEIYFIKNEDSYSPIFTEEMIDKMYGGIYSAYYNKLDEVASELNGRNQGWKFAKQ